MTSVLDVGRKRASEAAEALSVTGRQRRRIDTRGSCGKLFSRSNAPVFEEVPGAAQMECAEDGFGSSDTFALSPAGDMAAFTFDDGELRICDVSSGAILYHASSIAFVIDVAWAPDGKRLWVATIKYEHEIGDVDSIEEVTRGASRSEWSSVSVMPKLHVHPIALAYMSAFDLLVAANHGSLLIIDIRGGFNVIQSIDFDAKLCHVVCTASGSHVLVGLVDGRIVALARNRHGAYVKSSEVKAHSDRIDVMSLSTSGSLLVVGSEDGTASLWRMATPFVSFDTTPLVTFGGHTDGVTGAAFSGDEKYVVTTSIDGTIRVWRVEDGVEASIVRADTGSSDERGENEICRMSFHAASGTLGALAYNRGVIFYCCTPYDPKMTSNDRRVLLPRAEADLAKVRADIAAVDPATHRAAALERELLAEIDDHKARIIAAEAKLAALRTDEFTTKQAQLKALLEQEALLVSEISSHGHVLRELEDNTKAAGCLGYLHGDGFTQWLCDIGLGDVADALEDVVGGDLKLYQLADAEDLGLSFAESCSLLLHAYIAQHGKAPAPHFKPPPGLLSWDEAATTKWLTSLGPEFAAAAISGLTGPCLCSLSFPAVSSLMDRAAHTRLNQAVRDQLAAEGAPEWAQKWSALTTIGL